MCSGKQKTNYTRVKVAVNVTVTRVLGQWWWQSWQSGRFSTPEVRGLNPIIGKVFIEYCLLSTVVKRRK